jgi:hypothetical protein
MLISGLICFRGFVTSVEANRQLTGWKCELFEAKLFPVVLKWSSESQGQEFRHPSLCAPSVKDGCKKPCDRPQPLLTVTACQSCMALRM